MQSCAGLCLTWLIHSLETDPIQLSGSVYPDCVLGSILHFFSLFRTIPDTVSGLGFSVCYLLLSFHSKFRSGGVHSFYFTKLLMNPTQLDKLLLTISKWQRTLLKIEANCWRISVKIRSRKWREWLQWDVRPKWSPVWAWEVRCWLWYRSRSRWYWSTETYI